MNRIAAALCVATLVVGCGKPAPEPEKEAAEAHGDGAITLTAEQIAAANITLARPGRAGAGAAIEAPALIESDPDATRVVAAPLEGRVVSLTRNIGDPVRRGDVLAVIESREAANLQAEVEKARSRLTLASATLARDEALYARGFRPLREVEISKAAHEQAATDLRLARQRVSASGVRGGSLNRIVITAPISGRVVARTASLGQVFAADAAETELFRIAALDRLNVALSIAAADAARVRAGDTMEVTGAGRMAVARVRLVSPALDPQTRLVRVIADLDNRRGQWRVGEPVQARIAIGGAGNAPLMVPATAVQTLENRPVLFVRTAQGFRVVPVTLGARDGAMVAILSGISGDDQVATTNTFTLKAELGKGEASHED
ncbi:cobalt-zinc-cadmium efflux system membrane fusion protein [Sphingomonas kyeonggiensis]|uniref:Cobalt-zinc-cadmium efflux system membrane fusion protein n=1 Tax=Sphingomonas kyeonggiensis TaxID=1268553 RepID=A0A7W7K0E8_9SPHN|nr:efflux RND transporter periplasmic adaptor subunit [Sphingomonas kyeonggiensis]MBB4838718.1 cobalt-zinc-cadmium efflux system membrane fusion protein [Sphingomonas kyeonggiensis]